MKKSLLVFLVLLLGSFFLVSKKAMAMPLGSLVYRTSSDGKMYGYSDLDLVKVERGILSHLYTGHAGIYVGQENGVDYVVEALANGVVKTPAKNFVNRRNGEKLIGARLPVLASPLERVTAVLLAKSLALLAPAYDFDFQTQKGPNSGQWICSGVTEKVYESANTGNPFDLRNLQYDSQKYGVDITPDGFDDTSVVNASGDVLSQSKEFSKISGRAKMLLPAAEIFGYDVGLEKNGNRYFFLPFTQYSQPSLASVSPDIILESNFSDQEVRGREPRLALILKWSLVNNPLSSARLLIKKVSNKIFPQKIEINAPEIASSSVNIMPDVVQAKTDWQTLFPNPGYQIISPQGKIVSTTKTIKHSTSSPAVEIEPQVARVIDGDTFVLTDGRKIRYIGVDAPEIASATRKTTECRGLEAAAFNEQLLQSGKLILIADPSAKKDSYSRWLFYVYLQKSNGALVFVNQELVASGLADPYFCSPGRPTCPESTDKIRQQIIEEAGRGAVGEREKLLTKCKLEKEAIKQAVKASSTPVLVSTSTVTKISSSTPKIKTDTSTVAIVPKVPIASTSPTIKPIISKPPASTASSGGGSQSPVRLIVKSPLISKFYSSNNNHWLELFNTSEQEFDLANSTFRLEKTKTALDPSIMLRFSESADINYLGSSKIAPNSSFLIVGEKSDQTWRDKAGAIALNPNFTWGKGGYTFYSSLDVVSSSEDADIIEKIGFGEDALYFLASSAPALVDDYYLGRNKKADGSLVNSANNNFLDFKLFPLNIASTSLNSSTEQTTNPATSSTASTTNPEVISSSTPSSTMAIHTDGLSNLWHFDDCEGLAARDSLQASSSLTFSDYQFDFGKNGCALKLLPGVLPLNVFFDQPLTDQFSFSFDYLAQAGSSLILSFNSGEIQVNLNEAGFSLSSSSSFATNSLKLLSDGVWHQLVASFDLHNQLILIYHDGQEAARFPLLESFSLQNISFSTLNADILLDELAFWRRAILGGEVASFFEIGLPFYSSDLYNPLLIPQKAYYWHLGTADSEFHWYDQPKRQVLPVDFMPRDFSYEFWWRNISYPEDGRIVTALLNGDDWLVASVISLWYSRWNFFPQGDLLYTNDPFIPRDTLWHHFAFTYNSQDMLASWYIDGQEVFSHLSVWLKKPVKEIMIKAENYPFELSDFSLWEGALSIDKIREIMTNGRPFSTSTLAN